MVRVIKLNSEKIVPDEKLAEFLKLGYSLIDEKGQVIQQGEAQSKDDFIIQNKLLKDENKLLKAKIKELEASINISKEKTAFKCLFCEKEYTSQSGLNKHLKEKHPEKAGE